MVKGFRLYVVDVCVEWSAKKCCKVSQMNVVSTTMRIDSGARRRQMAAVITENEKDGLVNIRI